MFNDPAPLLSESQQQQKPPHLHRLSVIIVAAGFVVVLAGVTFAASQNDWWPFTKSNIALTSQENANAAVVKKDESPLPLLAQVEQAHFVVQYTGTEPLGATAESEGDMTIKGDYQYTTGIAKLPKEHNTNDPRDTTEGGLALVTMGTNVVRVGDHEFHKMNLQALVDANILPAESLTGANAEMLGAWEEGTQNKIQFFPLEFYYLQNFSNLATSLTKNSDGSWQGVVSAEVVKAMVWQTQRWRGDNIQWRYMTEEQKNQELKEYTPEEPKKFPTFTVFLAGDGALDRVVFKDLFYENTTTTFSRFTESPKIQFPEGLDPTSEDAQLAYAQQYNSMRAEEAKLVAYSIVEVYKGKTLPVTPSIRLDDTTNTIAKSILNDLALATLAHTPYTTRALEDAFWINKVTDPIPAKYYYGYASSDGKGFTLSFVQQRDGSDSAVECDTEKTDCIKVLRYPEN
ncbi:MAG: hypothetical protein AAB445_04685 [Patescibacteria group bacterium]